MEPINAGNFGLLPIASSRGATAFKKIDRIHLMAAACLVYEESVEGTRDLKGRHPADPLNFHFRLANPSPPVGDTAPRGSVASWSNVIPSNGRLPLETYEHVTSASIYGTNYPLRTVAPEFQEYPVDGMQANFNYGGVLPRGIDFLEIALAEHPQGKVRKFPVGGPLAVSLDDKTAGRHSIFIHRVTQVPQIPNSDVSSAESDVDQTYGLDTRRKTPLASVLRVTPLPLPATTAASKFGEIACVAALNFTSCAGAPHGGDHHAGFGAFTGVAADAFGATIPEIDVTGGAEAGGSNQPSPSGSGNQAATPSGYTGTVKDDWKVGPWVDGGEPQQVNAFMSSLAGGPITVGHLNSKHQIGKSKDGEFWNAGALDTRAFFTLPYGNPDFDGPLDFIQEEEPDVDSGFGAWKRVYLRFDSDVKHEFLTASLGGLKAKEIRDGRWRWAVQLPSFDHGAPRPADPSDIYDDFVDGGFEGGGSGGSGGSGTLYGPPSDEGDAPLIDSELPYDDSVVSGVRIPPTVTESERERREYAGILAGKHGDENPQYAGEHFLSLRGQPASAAGLLFRAKPREGHDPLATPTEIFAQPLVGLLEPAFEIASGDSDRNPNYTVTARPISDEESLEGLLDYVPPTSNGMLLLLPPEYRREDAVVGATPLSKRVSTTTFAIHPQNRFGFGNATPRYTGIASGFDISLDQANKRLDFQGKDADGADDNSWVVRVNGVTLGAGSTDWTRDTGGDPFLKPTTSGDDLLVDGVVAFGTATLSALRGLQVGISAATGSGAHDAFRAILVVPSGATGDSNVFTVQGGIEGTDSRTNFRGQSTNLDSDATAGTITNFIANETTVDNSSTGLITNRYGLLLNANRTGSGTISNDYGARLNMTGSATTKYGVDARITNAYSFGYAVAGQVLSGSTVGGLAAGVFMADFENHASGRSVAGLLIGTLGWTSGSTTRPLLRLNPDLTNLILTLDNYNGDPTIFKAEGGINWKRVEITAAGTTHNATWGEYIVFNITSGVDPNSVVLPQVTEGDFNGNRVVVEVRDSNGTDVVVTAYSGDAIYSGGSTVTNWGTNAAATKQEFEAGDYRYVYAECCAHGGSFDYGAG